MVATSPLGSLVIGDFGSGSSPVVGTVIKTRRPTLVTSTFQATDTISLSKTAAKTKLSSQIGAVLSGSASMITGTRDLEFTLGIELQMWFAGVRAKTVSLARVEAYDDVVVVVKTMAGRMLSASASVAVSAAMSAVLAQTYRSISMGAVVTSSLIKTLRPTTLGLQMKAIRRRVVSIYTSLKG